MDTLAFALGLPGATALGFGARFAWMALRALGKTKVEEISKLPPLQQPNLPLRSLSPVAIDSDMIRHRDGSYSAIWSLEFPPGHFRDESEVEDSCNRFSRILSLRMPPGTVIQFRLKVDPDRGSKIKDFLDDRPNSGIHPPARVLHNADLDYLALLAEKGVYRRQGYYLWVRVPATRSSDSLSSGSPKRIAAWVRLGVRGFLNQYLADQIVQRTHESEAEAREEAVRVFQAVHSTIPFEHSRLSGKELFNILYLSLNRGQKTIPNPGKFDEPIDVRPYLLRDEVTFGPNYMTVGDTPFARVTVSTPPNPDILPDALMKMTLDPRLHFPHTLIIEYVTLDQRKVLGKYDRRVRSIHRFARRITDKIEYSPEAKAALADLEQVRSQTTEPGQAVVQARVYALVEGPPAVSGEQLRESLFELDRRCEDVVSAFQSIPKVDAHRETGGSARFLLPLSMLGEATHHSTESEMEEMADSLACLIPVTDGWKGHRRPHFICGTVTNRLTGINLFSTQNTSSPLGILIGGPGSGKSVLMAQLANSVLSSIPGARVKAVDFGESFGALAEVCGGRHIRFTLGEVRAVNVWAYEGMTAGIEPDEQQIALVVNDLMFLARVPDHEVDAERVFHLCVKAVYQNELPRISRNPDVLGEPVLSNLLEVMRTFFFESESIGQLAQLLRTRLLPYQGHPWLDAPTHPAYKNESPLDIYELDSLVNFPNDIRDSIAYRVSAWVLRGMQKPNEQGQRLPLLVLFDEMHKLAGNFPKVFKALETAARQGRTANVVTLLGTHSYRDLSSIAGLVSTAGTVVIGKQNAEFEDLAQQAALTPSAIEAVRQISNAPGQYAQYLYSVGKGPEQRLEWLRVELSPIALWTYTTAPNERNARGLLRRIRPDLTMAAIVAWLASRYPRGLDFENLTELRKEDLEAFGRGGA